MKKRRYHFMLTAFFVGAIMSNTFLAAAEERINVANFSEAELSGWQEKSFEGHSQYRFVSVDHFRAEAGVTSSSTTTVLHGSTQGQASGLFKKIRIDLLKTPYLNWSWQVQNIFHGNDEHHKSGDDYPARIYVVVSGGLFFWQTKAINYVWSSQQKKGSEWPNAYTDHARMVAVRAGAEGLGQWQAERRNVREDLKRLFGEDITHIDVVAIMVDGDNTGQSASTLFGDIYFSAR
jgi:Protein of unknown function (DUF3047)